MYHINTQHIILYHGQTANINEDDILEYIWGECDKDKDIGFWQHLGE